MGLKQRRLWRVVQFVLAWTLWMLGLLGLGVVVSGMAMREAVAAQVAAAPAIATTSVTDTIYRADGTAASGTVLISWGAFSTAGGSSVPAGSTSVTIGAGGKLQVALVPNAGSNPMGSYYTVVYHLDDGSVTREYWVVPASRAGVTVSAIKSTVLPASVAMQTVSKAYVDAAIADIVTGHPEDSSPYVVKTGDTMTGPLNLPGDPVAPLQAADMQYVDEQTAALQAGLGQKVATQPQGAQTVVQPGATQLAVNNLNGAEYASQYVNGAGDNGISNATAGPACTSGCDVIAEQTYASGEKPVPTTWNNQTRVEDLRGGGVSESLLNPLNGQNAVQSAGITVNLNMTQPIADVFAATGQGIIGSAGVVVNEQALAGGSNTFPVQVQANVPYFKSTYSALLAHGHEQHERAACARKRFPELLRGGRLPARGPVPGVLGRLSRRRRRRHACVRLVDQRRLSGLYGHLLVRLRDRRDHAPGGADGRRGHRGRRALPDGHQPGQGDYDGSADGGHHLRPAAYGDLYGDQLRVEYVV